MSPLITRPADFGNRPYWLRSFNPPVMRIGDDARKCVIFVGNAPNGDDSFSAKGTAFLMAHEEGRYLVTAKHVAERLADAPFHVRINLKAGGGDLLHIDPLDFGGWYSDPTDPAADVAVMPFAPGGARNKHDAHWLSSALIPTAEEVEEFKIGAGDVVYAVGLFRLLQGQQRNVPIVHVGSIALMAGEEPLPVKNWPKPGRNFVNAHLISLQNLKGLSGAPVFARHLYSETRPGPLARAGSSVTVLHHAGGVRLFGIWSGSWEAEPDEVLALDHGAEVRAPVGFGMAAPVASLMRAFNHPALVEQRRQLAAAEAEGRAATPDGAV